jgi:hypothetical protein
MRAISFRLDLSQAVATEVVEFVNVHRSLLQWAQAVPSLIALIQDMIDKGTW